MSSSPRPLLVLLPTLALACSQDYGVIESARCDGKLQKEEGTVDAPFDLDGDGYKDGSNAECASYYTELDCNDQDPAINPNAIEVHCDFVDNDCNAETEDGADDDEDGFTECEDCDDNRAEVSPVGTEVICNDLDDDCTPDTPDAEDVDGDGFSECDDCDDAKEDVNPSMSEVECNGLDDDCNAETEDEADVDEDGVPACDDCNDYDDTVFSGAEEICDDGLDNDCDGDTDENCSSDYSGIYTLDATASYTCAYGLVSISVSRLTVLDSNPTIVVSSSSSQPGTMAGAFTSDTAFWADNTLAGTCTEVYSIEGEFTSETSFDATLTATFTGSCYGCTTHTWDVTGTR